MSEADDSVPGESAQAPEQGQLRIEKLFLKDASFESPLSPKVFTVQQQPRISVEINTRAQSLEQDLHEVVLTAQVTAKVEEDTKVAFVCEIQQAGIFKLQGFDAPRLNQVIGIACPNVLFPFLRENVDALVVKGGFPPLQLAPINFEALYFEAVREQQRQAAEGDHGTIPH